VLRVEAKALELAEHFAVADLEQVSVAALVHDYAKERSEDDFEAKIIEKNLDPDLLNWGNAIWHGVVGAEMIHDELQITDEDILNAVRRHTTGDVFMTTLDKLVYMADYIEDGRDFPGVDEVRQTTLANLDAGVAWQTAHTLNYLMAKQAVIYPKTILTYNAWVAQK
jgi:predicted HD superfamily hydrolase involved in NAD metabolism